MQVFSAVMSGLPLVWAFTMLGLFFGSLLPNRRTALLAALLIFMMGYFGKNMVGMLDSLEPLEPLFLFSYFDSSSALFTEGVNGGDVAVLLGVTAVGYLLAWLSFQRRDVTVGNWPWQRVRLSE